jgi:hypothetical protein
MKTLRSTTFERILNRLATDNRFSEEFFSDPKAALSRIGFDLTPEEKATLGKFKRPEHSDAMESFDERLVLCSSSGD